MMFRQCKDYFDDLETANTAMDRARREAYSSTGSVYKIARLLNDATTHYNSALRFDGDRVKVIASQRLHELGNLLDRRGV